MNLDEFSIEINELDLPLLGVVMYEGHRFRSANAAFSVARDETGRLCAGVDIPTNAVADSPPAPKQ